MRRKSECGVVGVYKVTCKCKLSKNNLCDMPRGWNLEDPSGSSSIYWHLLCASCCARAGKLRDESDVGPEHLGVLMRGVGGVSCVVPKFPPERGGLCVNGCQAEVSRNPLPDSSFLMTLSRSGHLSNSHTLFSETGMPGLR